MATRLVTVTQVPAGEGGAVLGRRSLAIANALVLSTTLVFWAAVAAGVGGIYLATSADRVGPGVGLVAVAVAVGWASGRLGLRTPGVPGNLYLRRVARRQVAGRRSARVVDPDRPGAVPVRFVQVVPRHHWGRLMWETATDTGFLQIDPGRREVRFEGDVERFVVPADAITGCDVADYTTTLGSSAITYSVCVLRGQTADGPWEAPISVRGADPAAPADHRRRTAEGLRDEVRRLLPDGWEPADDAVAWGGDEGDVLGYARPIAVTPARQVQATWAGAIGWALFFVMAVALVIFQRGRPPRPPTPPIMVPVPPLASPRPPPVVPVPVTRP